MPKNKKGGKGFKKGGRRSKNNVGVFNREEGHYYATILDNKGGNSLSVRLDDDRTVQVSIPGRYHRKVWVRKGDLICCTVDLMLWKVESKKEENEARKLLRHRDDTDTVLLGDNNEDEESDDEEDDSWRQIAMKLSSDKALNQAVSQNNKPEVVEEESESAERSEESEGNDDFHIE